MAFTSIVIVIVVLYVLGYAGMIVFDLFIKKDPVEFMPKPKDVDIDISDEAGQFKPIAVGKTEPQQSAAQNSAAHKSDDEVATAHPIHDEESGETSEEEKKAIASAEQSAAQVPPPLSATSFDVDSDKPKVNPSDDIGPRTTDEETQKRINELVKLRRGEILSEEMSAMSKERENMESNEENAEDSISKEEDKDASEVKDTSTEDVESFAPEVRIVGPEHTVSPKVTDTAGKEAFKEKTPSESNSKDGTTRRTAHARKPRPPKPQKQPEFHSDARFDILKVMIDVSKQQTKLQGARTAEQVSEEAKRASVDEAFMVIKQIDSDWEKLEDNRIIDEDNQLAIDKAAKENREAPPQFNV